VRGRAEGRHFGSRKSAGKRVLKTIERIKNRTKGGKIYECTLNLLFGLQHTAYPHFSVSNGSKQYEIIFFVIHGGQWWVKLQLLRY
jgi:hypothetical protein